MSQIVYVVIDEKGHPCYVAGYPDACHEHINEALDMGLTEAAQWKVRKFSPVSEER